MCTQRHVRAQTVLKIDAEILVRLVPRANALIERKTRAVGENQVQPRGGLVERDVGKDRIADITQWSAGCAAKDVVTVCGREG